ncbi:MAG: stage II sporulation protein M [Bacillota bacterium]
MPSSLRAALGRIRNYLIAALILFLLGITIGAVATSQDPDAMLQAIETVAKQLQQLGEDILSGPLGEGILLLFWHNLRTVLMMAVFGLALGIPAALGVLINGVIIGVVGVLSTQTAGIVPFLAGILPHGVFEIPALLIGAGVGLRLGLGPLLARRRSTFATPAPATWQGYGWELREALRVLLFCALLLAIAAAIEVSITPRLIGLTL